MKEKHAYPLKGFIVSGDTHVLWSADVFTDRDILVIEFHTKKYYSRDISDRRIANKI